MHPATLFTGVFTVYVFICCLGQKTYDITLAPITVLIITGGVLTFSAVTLLLSGKNKTAVKKPYEMRQINVSLVWDILLILIQIVTIFYFYKYLKSISLAYDGTTRSLNEMIKLFDTLTKFKTATFEKMNVTVPLLYRIGNPISAAGAWLCIYVTVNNFVLTKRVRPSQILIILLLVIQILMNGSRSPLFRIATMVIFLAYFFTYRNSRKRHGSIKTFTKIICAIGVLGIVMLAVLIVMGRWSSNNKILSEVFIYAGAPVVNLDTYLISGKFGISKLFGAQTFRGLYLYMAKWSHISAFHFGGISSFSHSHNGIEIGNVYTMYYKYIYDFGYWGVIPLTALQAWYYIWTHQRIKYWPKKHAKDVIDLRVFFYAYLINDLIMSAFSSRFYETVFDAPFIKLVVCVWLLDTFILERAIKIGNTRITLAVKTSSQYGLNDPVMK
jgi:hypothetical protein